MYEIVGEMQSTFTRCISELGTAFLCPPPPAPTPAHRRRPGDTPSHHCLPAPAPASPAPTTPPAAWRSASRPCPYPAPRKCAYTATTAPTTINLTASAADARHGVHRVGRRGLGRVSGWRGQCGSAPGGVHGALQGVTRSIRGGRKGIAVAGPGVWRGGGKGVGGGGVRK